MTARLDPAQLDDLKARTKLSDVLRTCGVDLKGKGAVTWALSPFNAEKTPSFKCDDRKGRFKCFSSGREGDHIAALMELTECSFHEAVETLGGTRQLTDGERRKIERDRQRLDQQDRARAVFKRRAAQEVFDGAVSIRGTYGEAYLEARGITLQPGWGDDLRFYAGLAYRGFKDQDDRDGEVLGHFPAMVAAIRDEDGALVGLHRTYLDPAEPQKLTPPGDLARNRAKKILGEAKGMIRLTPLADTLVMGEGIETTLAAKLLGIGPADACLAAGVSLGNMAGQAVGRVPHPDFADDPKRSVPNGTPDHARPGLVLPSDVGHVILLVDGDSEVINTRAHMCTAARRFFELERTVTLHPAVAGMDHNDMLLARLRQAVAA